MWRSTLDTERRLLRAWIQSHPAVAQSTLNEANLWSCSPAFNYWYSKGFSPLLRPIRGKEIAFRKHKSIMDYTCLLKPHSQNCSHFGAIAVKCSLKLPCSFSMGTSVCLLTSVKMNHPDTFGCFDSKFYMDFLVTVLTYCELIENKELRHFNQPIKMFKAIWWEHCLKE